MPSSRCPPRYPQTKHLFDSGATSASDKVLSRGDAVALLSQDYVLEEKVDGANICLYLDGNGQIQAQNRSHGVCAITSKQFSKLGRWIELRARQLRTVLQLGLAIYGEWLQAKHSVLYDALPDWFLVFDLLDLRSGCFLSVAARNRCLALADLAAVPAVPVPEPRPTTPEQLLVYLETLSSRCRGDVAPPEGLVVRVDNGAHHVGKAKLVNKWFIQAIESSGHWMHRAPVANQRVITERMIIPLEVKMGQARQAVGELLTQAVRDGRSGKYDNVLDACAKARLWMPYSPMAEILRAQALVGKKEWSRAVKSFRVCLQLLCLFEEEETNDQTTRAMLLANGNGEFEESMELQALQAKCRAGLKLCRRQQGESELSPAPSRSASPEDMGGVAMNTAKVTSSPAAGAVRVSGDLHDSGPHSSSTACDNELCWALQHPAEVVNQNDGNCQNTQPAPPGASSAAACMPNAAGSAVDVNRGRGASRRASKPAGQRPRLLMLVGLPGSGKSTFTKAVCDSRGEARCPWVVVSQDDLGSRRACEEAVGAVLGGRGRKTGQSVILDRCNCSPKDRHEWLQIAMVEPQEAAVIFFDYNADVCRDRVAQREDHPSIPFGKGARAVAHHSKELVSPSVAEGVARVHVIRDFAEASSLAQFYASMP